MENKKEKKSIVDRMVSDLMEISVDCYLNLQQTFREYPHTIQQVIIKRALFALIKGPITKITLIFGNQMFMKLYFS